MTKKYLWERTGTEEVLRHDDCWFVSAEEGWAINSEGQIIYTKNAGDDWDVVFSAPDMDIYFRCMSMTPSGGGWVGAIRPRTGRLWHSPDGQAWEAVADDLLPRQPTAICGIHTVGEDVIVAAGTQYPNRPAAIMRSEKGGKEWSHIDMDQHANLLIDVFFTDAMNGWVVGGKGGNRYRDLKPVVLRTKDGGKTWTNMLQDSGIEFPLGEWGWKIQFLDDQIGFVSLENFDKGAILKTRDGGNSWERIVVNDPQGNANLEGIGFLTEKKGWVGGWGARFPRPPGYSSGTDDGGLTWHDANEIGLFINRFRFTGETPIVAYAAGQHVYRCKELSDDEVTAEMLEGDSRHDSETGEIAFVSDSLPIHVDVPTGVKRLRVAVYDRRLRLAQVLCDEENPDSGDRNFQWDFLTSSGDDTGLGYYFYQVSLDEASASQMVSRVSRVAPEELGRRVAEMIAGYAGIANRSHDLLTLPDSAGEAVPLRSLFDEPVELMAALLRGGWVVPYYPDRSMLLESVIGSGGYSGPMEDSLREEDVLLLKDWIAAGAVLPVNP